MEKLVSEIPLTLGSCYRDGNDYGRGYDRDYTEMIANQVAELRRDVAKSEADIKESAAAGIHRLQIENTVHFNHLSEKLCDSEKEAIKAGYEARLEAKEAKADLLASQNSNTISIKDDIKDLRFSMDKQFCEMDHRLERNFNHVERVIDKKFDILLEREYKSEIASLRDKLSDVKNDEQRRSIKAIQEDVDKALCALGKVAPTVTATSVLNGCGC